MSEQEIRNELLLLLVIRYEQQRDQYMTLSKQTIDCSSARWAIAELRNEGLVEEQVRGVIRLTALGYMKYRSAPFAYADAV
jgi:Mn-dependent DtxR family transcriptional regulator